MPKFFLVTTALPETWDKRRPISMLGEWCKFNSQISKIKNRFSVIKKHYCYSEKKVYQDYKYIDQLYENLLNNLTITLNDYHRVKLSKRYWRIILGPWLAKFLHLVYDRWNTLEKINYKKDVSKTYVLNIREDKIIPLDMEEFDIFWDTDLWNHFIYSKILEEIAPKNIIYKKNFKYKGIKNPLFVKAENKTNIIKKNTKRYSIYKNNKIFIKNSYIGLKNEILLNLSLFSFPMFSKYKNLRLDLEKNINLKIRNNLDINFFPKSKFEIFIKKLIKIQIPQIFLESFNEINNFVDNCPWPNEPKVIFSSSMLWNSTADIFYVANKIEKKKTKLIYGQHGGAYAQYKYSLGQSHEIKVSDKYLTWGWNNKHQKNLIPFGQLKKKIYVNKYSSSEKKFITIEARAFLRYSRILQPYSTYSEKLRYYDRLKFILRQLKKKVPSKYLQVRDLAVIRKKGWHMEKYLNGELDGINYDSGNMHYKKTLKNSSLVIITVNSTSFLETLNSNYPTLICFPVDAAVYNAHALALINKLEKAKIFHRNPVSLAKHVERIWPNVSEWWFSNKTQNAVKNYCNFYSRPVEDKVTKLKKIINHYL